MRPIIIKNLRFKANEFAMIELMNTSEETKRALSKEANSNIVDQNVHLPHLQRHGINFSS